MIIDVQFSSAHNDWPELLDATLRAESLGYGTVWVLDHFDGSVFRGGDRPVLETCTFLGALAARTTTIGLGTLVANVANRHPAVLAAAALSVQRISGGRFICGVGAGAPPDSPWAREHHDRGIPLHAAMSDRHAAVIRQIEAVRAVTACPVIVGVNSVALAEVAGQFADGVNVRLSSPHAARYLAAARTAAAQHQPGRAFDSNGWASFGDHSSIDKAHELSLDRLILSSLAQLGPNDPIPPAAAS